jgi:acetyltransferase-like isoleucine patch superfamily enzyme
MRRLRTFIENVKYVLSVVMALLRGCWYIVYYRFSRRDVHIGFPFKAFAPVRIFGPGSVIIGRHCAALNNVFRGLTIVTLSETSRVNIGQGGHLGGLTIRCRNSVTIGDRIMTAISLVQDESLIHLHAQAQGVNNLQPPEAKTVAIGNNVWLGGDSIILGNSRIGSDCVVAAGSCCHSVEVGEYTLASGNPMKRPLPIDRLLKLKGSP